MTKLGNSEQCWLQAKPLWAAMDACEGEMKGTPVQPDQYDPVATDLPWTQLTDGSGREIERCLND